MNQTADNWWEIIKILIISLVFTANVPNQWGNNSNFCVWPYIRHNIMYEAWLFMMKMTKFWKMPLLLLPMSQKILGEIVEISQVATHIRRIAVPSEGKRWNFDNGQVFANYFSTLFGIFGNFKNVLTCSSQ